MIKPESLWSLFKHCDDDAWLGRVCRALGGQDVELDYGQRMQVIQIKQDSEWYDERCEKERERKREVAKKMRESRKKGESSESSESSAENPLHTEVAANIASSGKTSESSESSAARLASQSSSGNSGNSGNSNHPTYLPTNPPTIKNDNNNNHSHSHSAGVGAEGGKPVDNSVRGTNGNGNGNGNGQFQIDRTALNACASALNEDDNACFDETFSVPILCSAIVKDTQSVARWIQLAKLKGETAVRDECFMLVREMRAGEIPNNRGAALNARLSKLPDVGGAA